ncbi:MAG TPA: TetR/AcrR family transcriptional regulator [Bryobacteraceae bacterium]|nr:TetR/AcrR family transcriptional regulator [Bryobacteraceae bacterium]
MGRLSARERRAAIVDAAVKLFSEKGFRGTTTRELAASVGVSEPVLYQHFAAKKDLYAAIIDAKSNEIDQITERLRAWMDRDDDHGFFACVANVILDWHEQNPAWLRLFLFSALEKHEMADLFYERRAQGFFQMITAYVERRMQGGAFRSLSPEFAAHAFAGMVAHHGLEKVIFRRELPAMDRDAVVDGMVSVFLQGLRQPAS